MIGGDGLHNLIQTLYSPAEGIARALDRNSEGHFWNFIEKTLADCDRVLSENGFEDDRYPPDDLAGPFSEVWYAGHVGRRCHLVLWARDRGEPFGEVMLMRVMDIGAFLMEWEWRLNYRPAILTGFPVKAGASKGGDMRAASLRPRSTAIIEEVGRLVSEGHTASRAAELAKRNGFGTSGSANRKLWTKRKIYGG